MMASGLYRLVSYALVSMLAAGLDSNVCLAAVRLPSLFSSNMVLQRDQPIPVWGWADAGEKVTVTFKGKKYSTRAGEGGKWKVELPAEPAGGPFSLIVEGQNSIELSDILIGDVWVCSGQSNMEWPLKITTGAFKEISSYTNPNIRLFDIDRTGSLQPQNDLPENKWLGFASRNVANFSAVGYYFGKEIQQTQQVPVGLIQAAWGGTMVEGWMHPELLEGYPEIEEKLEYLAEMDTIPIREQKLARWRQLVNEIDEGLAGEKPLWVGTELGDSDWPTVTLPSYWEEALSLNLDGTVWFRKHFTIQEAEDIVDARPHLGLVDDVADIYINGHQLEKPYLSKWSEQVFNVDSTFFQPGQNVITVRVFDYDHRGGIGGEENDFYLNLGDLIIGLYGAWKYRVGADADHLNYSTYAAT